MAGYYASHGERRPAVSAVHPEASLSEPKERLARMRRPEGPSFEQLRTTRP
jgi:hypothetical protein